jgi:Zn-dependent peptidase ImmA (M78 family)
MRIGVDNFDSNRLTEALQFRMMTKSTLAREIEASPAAIASYLASSRKPSPEAFEKISRVLDLPKKFFLAPSGSVGLESSVKQWRSISNPRKSDRLRGESLLSWQVEIYSIFREIFDLPRFELYDVLPQFGVPDDFREITNEHIEDAAKKLRDYWKMGEMPINNLLRTAEKSGIVVGEFNLKVPQLDAVSTFFNGVPYVLLNTFKQSGARARFDLAHEIGHLILHRSVTKEDLCGDDGKAIYDRLEEQAHWFAGALLLPAERFANDLWAPTFRCFEDMKAKWKVSIQAMMHRAHDLNLITDKQYNWLNIALSKKKARIIEPLDDVITRESIRLFPKCFERYEQDCGRCQMLDLVNQLPFSERVTEELCGLGFGYFDGLRSEGHADRDNLITVDFKLPRS